MFPRHLLHACKGKRESGVSMCVRVLPWLCCAHAIASLSRACKSTEGKADKQAEYRRSNVDERWGMGKEKRMCRWVDGARGRGRENKCNREPNTTRHTSSHLGMRNAQAPRATCVCVCVCARACACVRVSWLYLQSLGIAVEALLVRRGGIICLQFYVLSACNATGPQSMVRRPILPHRLTHRLTHWLPDGIGQRSDNIGRHTLSSAVHVLGARSGARGALHICAYLSSASGYTRSRGAVAGVCMDIRARAQDDV